MLFQHSVNKIINQLVDSLQLLSNEQYCRKIPALSHFSIGQHVRHIIEMFVLLQEGYATGKVNYDNRKRDPDIESSRKVAITSLQQLLSSLQKENKDLVIEMRFDINSNQANSIPSNYYRELMYNMEHAIHHMALIKIGIREISGMLPDSDYGVAPSTIRYREENIKTNR